MLFDTADPAKEERNLAKHKVSFDEAKSIFADDLAASMPDPEHSLGEERWLIMGMSRLQRLLIISYTERNGAIRIISARKPTAAEKRDYERS